MSRNPAYASGKELFTASSIQFDFIPGQSKLFLDFEEDSRGVSAFYPNKSREIQGFADEMLANYTTDRNELFEVLLKFNRDLGAGEKTIDNVERLRSNQSVAVITGQQAGLFSGPIYTIYKALSAVKRAEQLSSQGIDAVPVFWVASEDHDFEEIHKTLLINRHGELQGVEVDGGERSELEPVGLTGIPNEIEFAAHRLFEMLAESEYSEQLEETIRECYRPGIDFSTAFARLISKLLSDYGLVFVSPLDKGIRSLSTQIYKNAIEAAVEIGSDLRKRDLDLEKSGYHSQVMVADDFFPFFYIDETNRRNALRFEKGPGRVVSVDGKYEFTTKELIKIADEMPERLSPNALMRPVVQDYLFPTVEYIGGSAEVAYFAQNSAIYEVLGRPVTPIQHRASVTIVEPKNRRTMHKYGIGFVDLFQGLDSIQARLVEQFLSPETGDRFNDTENKVRDLLDALDADLKKTDPTLSESLAKRRRKILWHLESLRRKYHRAETMNNGVLARRTDNLFECVIPNGKLQERSINAVYFLNMFGPEFVDWVYDSIEPGGKGHLILEL